jgi:internalin A
MKKTLICLTASIILAQVFPVAVALSQQPKTFLQWCKQKKSVSADTKRTIDILLQEAGTQDCKLADRYLSKLTELDLSINQLIDVQPLAGLTNLTELRLDSNQGFTNLTDLKGTLTRVVTTVNLLKSILPTKTNGNPHYL